MSSAPQAHGLHKLRFDVYEVDPRAGELHKHGYRVPLEDRPFRALVILLQQAPELVTREELQKELWPSDVFIDFDHGLNKAIGKVRRALNDSAEKPRFVETVGRRGYRFIGPLTPAAAPASSDGQDTGVAKVTPSIVVIEQPLRRWRSWLLAGAVALAILLTAFLFRPAMPKPQVAKIVQITKSGEAWPLEPMVTDGPRLYYQGLSANASEANWRVKQVLLNGNEESVIAGTAGPVHSFRVRGLSPDDTEFLALAPLGEHPLDKRALDQHPLDKEWMAVTLPVVGGSPRRLGNLVVDDVVWSHDGSSLAYSHGHQLFLANPDGTGSRPLATVPGDIAYLSWSRDDRRLGFTVLTEQQTLWEVGADGRGLHQRPFNRPGKALECCGSWTADGRYYVFRSLRDGASNLWAFEEKADWWRRGNPDPVQLTFGPMNYFQPLPSRNGKTLFAIGTLPAGELVRYDAQQKDFVSFAGGLSADHLDFSRDGQWIAYVTVPERTLWRARSDGSQPFQLTSPPLQVESRPHWSSDGKRITFAAKRPGELLRLYTVSVAEGNLDALPAERWSQATPDWMPDQNSLVYGTLPGTDDPSDIALYRIDLRTHRNERIPGSDGLYNPLWSPDGHQLAAVDSSSQRLFLFDINSGRRTQLSEPAVYPIWSADSQYLYFGARNHQVLRVHVPDGHEENVLDVPFRTASASFGLAPDGAPIILREHGHFDIYALSLDAP